LYCLRATRQKPLAQALTVIGDIGRQATSRQLGYRCLIAGEQRQWSLRKGAGIGHIFTMQWHGKDMVKR
jgi:hypothetical protein